MSARAAWRLESLGFTEVYRYTAGKADWLANGLPTDGTKADAPTVGDLARRDILTCSLTDRVGDVRGRVQADSRDVCIVVNDRNIVLGRLRHKELDSDPSLTVEQVMEDGPTTYRLDRPTEETAKYLTERKVESVLVTTSDGELIGLFYGDDAKRQTGGDEGAS